MRTLKKMADGLIAQFVPSVDAAAGCTPMCFGPGSPVCQRGCPGGGGRGCNMNPDCSITCFD